MRIKKDIQPKTKFEKSIIKIGMDPRFFTFKYVVGEEFKLKKIFNDGDYGCFLKKEYEIVEKSLYHDEDKDIFIYYYKLNTYPEDKRQWIDEKVLNYSFEHIIKYY